MSEKTFIEAQNQAIEEEMAQDVRIFVIGENVSNMGYGSEFIGLFEKYGASRVLDTHISESAILGAAIGAACTGMRPIASLMFVDFLGRCADELLNQLQMRYMLAGQDVRLPLVITCAAGGGFNLAGQHSKTLIGWLMQVQGLKIVGPSTAYDMKGLMKSAIRDDNPVIVLTHKMLGMFSMSTYEVPDEEYLIPLGKADIKREGRDVTIVATMLMVHRALAAADKLQEMGISVEIIDPRTIVPLDKQTILASVRKTGRLVIMEEAPITGSFASEVSAIVAEEIFECLTAPIKRVCAPDTPTPYSTPMEKWWMPDDEDLVRAVTAITI